MSVQLKPRRTMLFIDSYGHAHYRATCPEVALPTVGAVPLEKLQHPVCADCEPPGK